MPHLEDYDNLLYLLNARDEANVINFKSDESFASDIRLVTWGLQTGAKSDFAVYKTYNKIESYFSEDGEHISTHMAGKHYNGDLSVVLRDIFEDIKRYAKGELDGSNFTQYDVPVD